MATRRFSRAVGIAASVLLLSVLHAGVAGAAGGVRSAGPECWDPAFPMRTFQSPAALPTGPVSLKTVRLSHVPGFDRVEFEFNGDGRPAVTVGVVDPTAVWNFEGGNVKVSGAGALQVDLSGATHFGYYDAGGRDRVAGATTNVTEVVNAASLDSEARWAIGMADGRGFRTTWVASPTRLVVDVPAAGTAGPPAPVTWTRTPFRDSGAPGAYTSVRSGGHLAFDRFVLDFGAGPVGGVSLSCGVLPSGQPFLRVTARPAAGVVTAPPAVATWFSVALLDAKVEAVPDQAGLVDFVLLLDGARPQFRTFELTGPNRLVIDVR